MKKLESILVEYPIGKSRNGIITIRQKLIKRTDFKDDKSFDSFVQDIYDQNLWGGKGDATIFGRDLKSVKITCNYTNEEDGKK